MVKAIDEANMDKSVSPGEDFFQFSNGAWIDSAEIPGEYTRWGVFELLMEENLKVLREIHESCAASVESSSKTSNAYKVGLLFKQGMDEAAIETEGPGAIKALTGPVEQFSTEAKADKLGELVGWLHRSGVNCFFNFYPGSDFKNSSWVIAQLRQPSLGLPDRDYYFQEDKEEVRMKYKAHLVKVFETVFGANEETAKSRASLVYETEERLAKVIQERVVRRQPDKVYHKMELDGVKELVPESVLSWDAYLRAVGKVEVGSLNVDNPEYFKELATVIKELGPSGLAIMMQWTVARSVMKYLSKECVELDFDFYSRTLGGQKDLKPRWKRLIFYIGEILGEAVSEIYVERAFPPEAKKQALEIVTSIKDTLAEKIKSLTWMKDETKEKALTKLNKFRVKIGYPDRWMDYSALFIDESKTFLENIVEGMRADWDHDMTRINAPVDLNRWEMTAQTVNAYFHPLQNEIVFPAAILQFPFFSPKCDLAVNYGAMGVVVAHECTHGYDDQGRKYDAEGNLNDWWTSEDSEEYNTRAKKIVEQFSSFIEFGKNVNGELCQGENIADLGGLKIAYAAMQKALDANPKLRQSIDGFTPEQRFFLSYSQLWRSKITEQDAHRRLVIDPHSPAQWRVKGPLRNMVEFFQAFDVKEGDYMYLPEEERVAIW